MKKRAAIETRSIYEELCEKIGTEKVKNDEAILVTYGFDVSSIPFRKPSFIVLPESREDVQEVLRIANEHIIPVTPMSGGVTMQGFSIPSEGGILLDFANMNKILEINTESGYAVIEPGVTYDKFTSALSEKQFRCHVPTSPGATKPLANYLMTPSGSLGTRHFDPIISLEVVLPNGTIVHTGSDAFPNTAPYSRYGPFPDLTGLFCCSYGTLGIVTKGSVRIYPKNESNRVNVAGFNDYESSVKFVRDVIANNIAEHCIIWNWQACKTYDISFSSTGKPNIPAELLNDPRNPPADLPYNIVTTLMSGYEEMMVVSERTCARVAEKYGGRAISTAEMEKKFPGALRAWRGFYLEYHQAGMEHIKKYGLGLYLGWITRAQPKDMAAIEKLAMESLCDLGLRPVCYYSQPYDFDRCMFLRIFGFVDPRDKELLSKIAVKYKQMYDLVMERYGAIPNRYDPHATDLLPKLGGYHYLLTSIKKVIDPNNILNPDTELF